MISGISQNFCEAMARAVYRRWPELIPAPVDTDPFTEEVLYKEHRRKAKSEPKP